jgi:hypothetical protein
MTRQEDDETRAMLGIPADATLVRARLAGASFGKSYAPYQLVITGTSRGFGPGFTMGVDIRLAVACHADTPAVAIVEVDPDGRRRVRFEGLENDDRPETLMILNRGRKLAQLTITRGGRPVGTGQIENDDQVRTAVAAVRRGRRVVTRGTVATEANVPESALRRHHRARGMTWVDYLASLE